MNYDLRFAIYAAAALLSASARGAIPPPNTYDWEANQWRSNVTVTLSSSTSATTYVDVVRFAQLARQWGVRSRIVRLNLYCGNDLASCRAPLFYESVGGPTDYFTNFVSGDYSEGSGLTGNGSTKYVVLGPSGFSGLTFESNPPFPDRNDLHYGVYNRTDGKSASLSGYVMGSSHSGVPYQSQVAMLLKYTDDYTYFRMGNLANYIQTNQATVLGFNVGVRRSNTDCSLYRNAAEVANYSPGSAQVPPYPIFVHAADADAAPSAPTARTLAGYTVGYALSTTQLANYYTLMQWFQKARGRAV